MAEIMTPGSVAIIGGGLSGALVATHLLQIATFPLTIYLIERSAEVGKGVAYRTDYACHLLNVPVVGMSAFGKQPTHFWDWLRLNAVHQSALLGLPTPPTPYKLYSFVPRKLYGAYIQDVLAQAETAAPNYVQLKRIHDEAIALQIISDHAVITCHSGLTLTAQKVVLALGNFPPSDPISVRKTGFHRHSAYISYAWQSGALAQIPPQDQVLLIGSGLTMIDMVVALHAQGHQGSIVVVSQHGLLPQTHEYPTKVHPPFLKPPNIPGEIAPLLKLVRRELEIAKQKNRDWRSVMDAMRPYISLIWRSLPLKERRRFLRHVRPYWDTHRHRMAPQIAELIQNLLKSQQVMIYTGRIQNYQVEGQAITVTLKARNNITHRLMPVNWVINCTGPESDYRKFEHPLVVNLLQQGFVCPDTLGMGLATAEEGALLMADGTASFILYTLGPPQKGSLWETTAVPEIRIQAERLAQVLLNAILV